MLLTLKNYAKGLIPDDLILSQLVLRHSQAWQEAGLIFVHVPKNGGTSINMALYGKSMGHFRARDIVRVRPNLLSDLPSLALTRNPWARAYSAYNFARMGSQMSDGAQIRNPQKYTRPEFSSFEKFVLEWLPSRNLEREDYVFRPQIHFILGHQGDVLVRHVGRLETQQSYLAFLEDTLGRKLDIQHLNRTAESVKYRQAYTSEMRDALAQIYVNDVKRFNYDF